MIFSNRMYDSTLFHKRMMCVSQKRTMMSFVNQCKYSLYKNMYHKIIYFSFLKKPLSVEIQSPDVLLENRIYSPYFMKISERIHNKSVYMINQYWRNRLNYITSFYKSYIDELVKSTFHKYNQPLDLTGLHPDVQIIQRLRHAYLILRFKQSMMKSGFTYKNMKELLDYRTTLFSILVTIITLLMEISPEALLIKPDAFFCEKLPEVLNYVREGYVHNVWTTPSEPINCVGKDILPQTTSFDPLHLSKKLIQPIEEIEIEEIEIEESIEELLIPQTPGMVRRKTIAYMFATMMIVITILDQSGYSHIIELEKAFYSIG